MPVSTRIIDLVRRISAPNNQSSGGDSFYPYRDHPIYSVQIDSSLTAPRGKVLDNLYHKREFSLLPYEPSDHRIGSENELQGDINELIRSIAFAKIKVSGILDQSGISKEQLDKALTVSTVFSGVSDIEFFYYYLYVQKYKFPENAWSKISGQSGLAHGDERLAEKILEEILHLQKKAYNTSTAFNQWTQSFRSYGSSWFFEKFLKQINGATATRDIDPGKSFFYRKFSPSSPQYANSKITINDFPGPGLVIYGLHSKIFANNYINHRFSYGVATSTQEKVESEQWRFITEGEKDLQKTIFGFFRGLVIVYNKEKMCIKGRPYGLVIFNDHFPHNNFKTAYLIRHELLDKFISNPYLALNRENILNPDLLDIRNDTKDKVINVVSLASQAGFCEEALSLLSKAEPPQKLSLHNDITRTLMFGTAQLDLIREAFRQYSLGYYYDNKQNNFYENRFLLLKELLRINRCLFERSVDDKPIEYPVVFPFTALDHSIDPDLVLKTGFVSSSMTAFTEGHPKGTTTFFNEDKHRRDPDFEGHINFLTELELDEIDSLPDETIIKNLGSDDFELWKNLLEGWRFTGANPMIVDHSHKKVGVDILKGE